MTATVPTRSSSRTGASCSSCPGRRDRDRTTNIPAARPEDARIDGAETAYRCEAANRFFSRALSPQDVIASWSGVRPLYDDGDGDPGKVTRDYVLDCDRDGPALLTIYGGKITTALALAEDAVGWLAQALGSTFAPMTLDRPFPGGDTDIAAREAELRTRWPYADAARLAQHYGSRALRPSWLLRSARSLRSGKNRSRQPDLHAGRFAIAFARL